MRKLHVSSTSKIPEVSEFSVLDYSEFNIKRNEKTLIKNPEIHTDANDTSTSPLPLHVSLV